MIVCGNHPGREADYHCARCQAAFCKDCITIKDFGRAKIEVCPLCANPVTNLDPYRMVPPVWERAPKILLYPLSDDEWYFNFLGWGIFALVLNGMAAWGFFMGGPLGFIGGSALKLVYVSMLLSYFYRIIDRSEEGRVDVPAFTEFQGLGRSLVAPVIQYYLTFLLMFWPITLYFIYCLIFKTGGFYEFIDALRSDVALFIYLVGGIYGLFFTPMGLLILGLTRDFNKLINPVYIVRQVIKIPKEYFLTLAIILAFIIIYAIIYKLTQLVLVTLGFLLFKILYYFVDGMFQLYMFMVFGHLLGYLGYQARFKLKWWPETEQEPVFMVGGRPQKMTYRSGVLARLTGAAGVAGAGAVGVGLGAAASMAGARPGASLGPQFSMPPPTGAPPGAMAPPAGLVDDTEQARLVAEAMSMVDHGRHNEAIQIFQGILDREPRNLAALRGMTLAHLRKKEPEKAAEYATRQAAEFTRDKALEPVWEIYAMMSKEIQDFVIESRDQVMLARWLNEQGMHMEAARVLRALAVKRPDDPIAPKAMYQCAELLWKQCGKPETAAQIYNYILKRYPDSPLIGQVREALAQMK